MRILHTADWHLGRLFHQLHLTDDQAHVLDQFVTLARETRPDVVVIAGDIYDRAVPPPEAVALLDEVLCRLALDCAAPIVLIAGNHDSPQRLNFASRLLAERGVHLLGTCGVSALDLHDDTGTVRLYAVPYAEPPVVREQTGEGDIHDHEAAMRALLDGVRAGHPGGMRSVLLAHAFAAGGAVAEESERPLSVGGSGAVSVEAFAGFDYVALGHLHRPQSLGDGRIRYAGSLLKYSFSEADQPKSVSLVEMDARGQCRVEEFTLSPRHDVRRIAGAMQTLLTQPEQFGHREDYLQVEIQDKGAVLDAMGRLRAVYPNVLHIVRPELTLLGEGQRPAGDHRALDTAVLFGDFYAQVTGEEPDAEEAASLAAVLERMRRAEREVTA